MHAVLDVEMPVKDRRRRLFVRFCAGMLGLVLVVMAIVALRPRNTIADDRLVSTDHNSTTRAHTTDRSSQLTKATSLPPHKVITATSPDNVLVVTTDSRDQSSTTGNLNNVFRSKDVNTSMTISDLSDSRVSQIMVSAAQGVSESLDPALQEEVQLSRVESTLSIVESSLLGGTNVERRSYLKSDLAALRNTEVEQIPTMSASYVSLDDLPLTLGHIEYTPLLELSDAAKLQPYAFAQGLFLASSPAFALGGGLCISKNSNSFFAGIGLLKTRYRDEVVASGDPSFEDIDAGGVSSIVTPNLNPNSLWGYTVEFGYDRSISARFRIGVRADFLNFWHVLPRSNETINSRSSGTYLYDAVRRQVAISPTITYSPLPKLSVQLGLRQAIYEQGFATRLDLSSTAFPASPVALARSLSVDIPTTLALTLRYQF